MTRLTRALGIAFTLALGLAGALAAGRPAGANAPLAGATVTIESFREYAYPGTAPTLRGPLPGSYFIVWHSPSTAAAWSTPS